MDWDSLPDEISTNIARDKEFKGQTQTEQKLRSLIQQIIKEEMKLNETQSVEDFVDILLDMAIKAGIIEAGIIEARNEEILDIAISIYDDLFGDYEEVGQGISTSDYSKALDEFKSRVKNLK